MSCQVLESSRKVITTGVSVYKTLVGFVLVIR